MFHTKTITQSLQDLQTSQETGLSTHEAQSRLATKGPNRLKSEKKKPLLLRILAQFKDFLVLILLAAAIISVIASDGLKDAILIAGILLINVIISITQENRADNALAELKNISSPKAKVKRDGHVIKIDSHAVVAGDVVILDAGDYIPADIRIIEGINLKIDEAALTGESLPVTKDTTIIPADATQLGDKTNLAFMGTIVTYGRGMGAVYATGMDTEMGKIATILNQTKEANTPLQDRLNAMAKTLGIVCIITCVLIFGIGFLRGMDVLEMFMVSVSLAVAAVPEGVAIVATVILAIGVQKMVKSNVIVKRLRAVETLGSTTVICSDKTGTLTQNKMTVVKLYDSQNVYEADEIGASLLIDTENEPDTKMTPNGHKKAGTSAIDNFQLVAKPAFMPNVTLMSEIAVLCNDAIYEDSKIIGDPTEGALLAFGAKLGYNKETLSTQYKRVQEIPFDSDRKLMSTYNTKDGKIIMNTKGAPDNIISRSAEVYLDGKITTMTDEVKQRLTRQNEDFAAQALRVLAFAYKEYENEAAIDNSEDNLIFVGMMCMMDPPRTEAKAAIAQCHKAGISVKMITGDHKITAAAIATGLGIIKEDCDAVLSASMEPSQNGDHTGTTFSKNDKILSGVEIDTLSDAELANKTKTVNVFARVSPEHKVRIITAIKENGNIAAMTGDGVNDAPSLKKADIGIAMGITGTDVSKEAADMILTDDNFVSIVAAVEQGRTIYGNIQKVTGYLLSCNIGEILIIFAAILFGLPAPLVATQLLFVNLLTDAFPAFALGMEVREPGVMDRPPRNPKEPIINKSMRSMVAIRAALLSAACLGAFLYGYHVHGYAVAISMCFFTLVAAELLMAFACKSSTREGFGVCDLFSNKFLNISMMLSLMVLLAVMYVPFLNQLFTTKPLSLAQLAVCMALVMVPALGTMYKLK